MGRHNSQPASDPLHDRSSRPVGMIIAAIVILALIAGLTWMLTSTRDSSSNADGKCAEKDRIIVTVAESRTGIAREMINKYQATQPVGGCAAYEPVDATAVKRAAVLVSDDDPYARVAAAERQIVDPVNRIQVKLGVNSLRPDLYTAADQIAYPVATNPDVAAVAATYITNSDVPTATELVTRDRTLTVENAMANQTPYIASSSALAGYTFHPMEATAAVNVALLTPTDIVSEDAVNEGKKFLAFLAQNPPSSQVAPDAVNQVKTAAGLPLEPAPQPVTPSPAPEDPAAPAPAPEGPAAAPRPASDTMFLLDTSDRMAGSNFQNSAQLISGASTALRDGGHDVALWNYSSPLNPGVTKGWRANVGFDSPQSIPDTVNGFGTGGQPQTRSAVIAALEAASAQAREKNEPVNLVVITAGTAADMDDARFNAELDRVSNPQVQVNVLHLGNGPVDETLRSRSSSHQVVANPADLQAAAKPVLGL